MPRSFVVLCLLLSAFSLVGFGCKERGSVNLPGVVTPPTPKTLEQPYVFKQGGVEEGASPDILKIRQVLTNLNKAKSYQADLQLPSTSGSAKGQLLYAKERGMLASLVMNDVRSDLYLSASGDEAYIRYATSSWSPVPKDTEGQQVRDQLKTAFFFDDKGGNNLLIRDSAKLLSKTDDPKGCTLYTLEQTFYIPEITSEKLELCLTSSYPVSIRLVRSNGTSLITYSRIDDPAILAESPLK